MLAEDMQPGAKFQVELFEAGDGWQSLPEPATPPRAIDTGPTSSASRAPSRP
ncbi:MAG: hypothetical protein IPK74_34225 [Deltaproteobacteria bacterium]|nr:hypothetical protein [Deltaproteobacteria bacterium]